MKYHICFIMTFFSLFAFSAHAEEETCVENLHVIGHRVRVAFIAGNYQDYIKSNPLAFTPLPLSETLCEMPPAKFHLAVLIETDKKNKASSHNDADIMVTNEEFTLGSGDYLGFTVSSDKSGNLQVFYARPLKNQFNQPAALMPLSIN